MFSNLIVEHGATGWRVNTGWRDDQFGVGKRTAIRHTRALLDGSLTQMEFHKERFFGLSIPAQVPCIPDAVLDPRQSWADKTEYDRVVRQSIKRFEENFAAYEQSVGADVKAAAIRSAADGAIAFFSKATPNDNRFRSMPFLHRHGARRRTIHAHRRPGRAKAWMAGLRPARGFGGPAP